MIRIFDNLAGTGLVTDQPLGELPPNAWTDAKHVRFVDGVVRKMQGYSQVGSTIAENPVFVFDMDFLDFGYCTDGKVYKVFGGVATDISASSGTHGMNPVTGWTQAVLPGGVIVLNSGLDAPIYSVFNYQSSLPTFAYLPAWPSSFLNTKIIRGYKSFLMAFGFEDTVAGTISLEQIRWSNRADPGFPPTSWNYADTTQPTGTITLPFQGRINDALILRDSMIVYQDKSIYALTEVGGVTIMSLRKIFDNAGAYSANCVVALENKHVVLGSDDVFYHDGVQITSLMNNKIRDAFFKDFVNQYKPYVVMNRDQNEVWFCIPNVADLSTFNARVAWIWNYRDDKWTKRDIPPSYYACEYQNTGTFSTRNNSRILLADRENMKFFLMDDTEQANGANMTCYVERRCLPLGADGSFDFRRKVFIREITPEITGTAGGVVNVYLSTRDSINGTATVHGPYPYTIGTSRKLNCRVSGRVIDIKFESTTNITWDLVSYGVNYRLADSRR